MWDRKTDRQIDNWMEAITITPTTLKGSNRTKPASPFDIASPHSFFQIQSVVAKNRAVTKFGRTAKQYDSWDSISGE